jgi:hypothetical protein
VLVILLELLWLEKLEALFNYIGLKDIPLKFYNLANFFNYKEANILL